VEPIALEFLSKESVRSLQRFMKVYGWDDPVMLLRHQALLSQVIASPKGMLNVDASEFPKKGTHSVGVAHQYCGHHGKTENCQSGVFVGYSSNKGYGLLACQLYMPKIWFSGDYRSRREETLVPENLVFQTKTQIATKLLTEIAQTGRFPAKWIGCDAGLGSEWEFLESLPKTSFYFAAIRSNLQVFLQKPQVGIPPYNGRGARPTRPTVLPGEPQPFTVAEVAQSFEGHWKKVVLAEGAKGPIVADVAAVRAYPAHEGLPRGPVVWLFIRRTEDGQLKYAFSNAPEDTPFEELCEASVMRWPIEQCFADGKSHVGMDEYEHRSWPAWNRHMLYVFLALHFLLRMRLHLKKNSIAHSPASETTCRLRPPSPLDRQEGGARNRQVPHHSKLPRLPMPSEKAPCACGNPEL
jgi:SRSO17 transposase